MAQLPSEIKLTLHAQQRLLERRGSEKYNTKNLMRSSCKWYGKDDLIPESSLYIHCLYVCRKAKNKMGYITDGNIEVLYDKNAKVAITILEVKDKFKPITQYIKPEYLKKIESKKERKRMSTTNKTICPDCEREMEELNPIHHICDNCLTRKRNMTYRKREYIPYKDLSDAEKHRIDSLRLAQHNRHYGDTETTTKVKETKPVVINEGKEEVEEVTNTNYYQMKAEQKPVDFFTPIVSDTSEVNIPSMNTTFNPLSDASSFIKTIRSCGYDISEDNMNNILNVLFATDKLQSILSVITENSNVEILSKLDQILIDVEKKLQQNWELSGFQEAEDIRFKGFLTWRRTLKNPITFWKQLYSNDILPKLQQICQNVQPATVTPTPVQEDNSTTKKYQITTESISTILNTRRPFTRVFYATSKDDAYKQFIKWMDDRQLHENKNKTTIVELQSVGEDGRTNK